VEQRRILSNGGQLTNKPREEDAMIKDPPLLTIRRHFERPSPDLIAKLAGAQTGHIVDALLAAAPSTRRSSRSILRAPSSSARRSPARRDRATTWPSWQRLLLPSLAM